MRRLARPLLLVLVAAACSPTTGPLPTGSRAGTSTPPETTTTVERDCVRVTGTASNVSTGSPAGDALFLAGELFICADDVVIAPADDLNSLAAGAQLAAALGGPLLLPHPQLAAEVGRLKPLHVHIIGDLEVSLPPNTDVSRHGISDAVNTARAALGAVEEIRLPADPDASTIVETVNAIAAGDRVVLPQTAPPGAAPPTPPPPPDPAEIVTGLAVPTDSPKVWLVDAADPVAILTAAGSGHAVDAQVVAFDPSDILAHPELGTVLAGRAPEALRFFGEVPESSQWDVAVLVDGRQLPGGGFRILGDDRPKRYVAFYGHPTTPALGVLGEQGPQATLDRLTPFLPEYEADGYLAIPTFEMMASVASADASDGDYSAETSTETLRPWVDFAAENGIYVILDLQPGRDDFLTQAQMYEELLRLPHVGLALDPEWRLKPDQVHLKQIGRVEAAEVNTVVHWLADLVRDNGLPQKMLIVHQFREFMIQNRETLEQRPELQMVIQMDGQGPIPTKDETWAVLTRGTEDNHWRWGWKNFFDEDTPTPTADHVLGKVPIPVFVSYQ